MIIKCECNDENCHATIVTIGRNTVATFYASGKPAVFMQLSASLIRLLERVAIHQAQEVKLPRLCRTCNDELDNGGVCWRCDMPQA
jgi:hypothetical protein